MAKQSIDFQKFVNYLRVGIYRSAIGRKGQFVYFNETFSDMFDFKKKDLPKLSVDQIFAEQRRLNTFVRRIYEDGAVKNFEVRLKGKQKRSFWCSISAIAVKDKKGVMKWVDVIVDDISVRKHFEKELVESKELFQTVFDNTAAAITVTDKDDKIVAWNPFAEKMLGMSKESLFNKPMRELYPPKEWKKMRHSKVRKKGMVHDIETQITKPDSVVLDVSVSLSHLKDSEGTIIGSIGIMRDITNQKAAERKIRESESKIRIILDNSAAVIILTDKQDRIVSWNKFTEQLLGFTKKDIHLNPVHTLYPAEEWKKIRAENIRKTGSKHHMETKVFKKDGGVIDVNLSINVLRDSKNEIIGSVGIMQDITKQKKVQQILLQAKLTAEEANSAKSLFLANMSHEVRTPMNTIMGMIDLTLDTSLTEEQEENLQVVKDAADNLLGLLNDILDLSRVEAGKIILEEIEFHLPNVVKSVCKGMTVIAREKKLGLNLNIHPQVPNLVVGDPVRIRQVLINLINNALKFTHKGEINIDIKVLSKSREDIKLQFSVNDEGIGIPSERLTKIFDVFTQADSTTTRKFGGTGLGLAISKKLVEMMKGSLWVESEESKGSTFFFTAVLRVVKNEKRKSLDLEKKQEEEKRINEKFLTEELRGLRVLVAEDNEVNQKIVVRMLEKLGWKVRGVENGREVLHVIDKNEFDVIIMDAQMPVLDGLETTKLIRSGEEKTGKHIAIIALTGRAMAEDKLNCLAVGMDGYVTKPIDRKKLFGEIGKQFKKGRTYG